MSEYYDGFISKTFIIFKKNVGDKRNNTIWFLNEYHLYNGIKKKKLIYKISLHFQ